MVPKDITLSHIDCRAPCRDHRRQLRTRKAQPHSPRTRFRYDTNWPSQLSEPSARSKAAQILSPFSRKLALRTSSIHSPSKSMRLSSSRAINENTGIPFPISEFISKPWHKVILLVQIELTKSGWPNKLKGEARKELHKELAQMCKLLDRVLRCLADILGERGDGRGLQTTLDLLRSVKARVWEKSNNHLLQVEGIGPAKKDRLVKANIKTIKDLAKMEFYHIERILSRNPPFGQTLLHKVAGFPILTLDFEVIGQYTPETPTPLPVSGTQTAGESLWIARAVLGFTNEKTPSWNASVPWTTLVVEGGNGRLVWFWRGSAKRLAGSKEMIIGLSAKSGEQLKVSFACEEIVGTTVKMDVWVRG
ncbi:hypothetical protein NXS19_014020 [Fusarium pseudograminearum]|nr:hypothetical protein NXS19_014020 [Fusarium pseudograminearum]